MISYKHITQRIEGLAKGTALVTLFALPISTSITTLLFLLTTLLITLSGNWKEKINLIISNRITLVFWGFFLVYLIGSTYSIGSSADIKHQLVKFSWLLLAPLWTPLFINTQWRTRAINAFLIAMLITLILSFIKYFQWIDSPSFWHVLNHRITLITSVFKDYIIQSFLMSLAAMIFLFRFIHYKRWGYAALFLLASIDILFISPGRTGYIIFFLLCAYTLFSQLGFKKSLFLGVGGIAILGALLVFLPGPIHERTHHALQDIHQWDHGEEKTSLGYRMAWQKNAWELFKQRPIIGYGTGSIHQAFANLPQQDTQQTGIVDNASNEYLNIAVQFGSVGLLVFLLMLLMQWRYSFSLTKEHALIIQTMLIAIGVGNFANSWLMDFTQGHYYALMTVVMFAAFSRHPKHSKMTDRIGSDDAAAAHNRV